MRNKINLIVVLAIFAFIVLGCATNLRTIYERNPPAQPSQADSGCVESDERLDYNDGSKAYTVTTCTVDEAKRIYAMYGQRMSVRYVVKDFGTARKLNRAYAVDLAEYFNEENDLMLPNTASVETSISGYANKNRPTVRIHYGDVHNRDYMDIENFIDIQGPEAQWIAEKIGLK